MRKYSSLSDFGKRCDSELKKPNIFYAIRKSRNPTLSIKLSRPVSEHKRSQLGISLTPKKQDEIEQDFRKKIQVELKELRGRNKKHQTGAFHRTKSTSLNIQKTHEKSESKAKEDKDKDVSENKLTRKFSQKIFEPDRVVVISNLADFTALSPQEGYLHFSYYPFKEKTPNGNKKRVSFGLSSTLSSNKVLVHENEGQIVYSIAEYERSLYLMDGLRKISYFKDYQRIKIFRKWKVVYECNLQHNRKSLLAGQIKIIYREIYVELMGELEEISHFKFIGLKNQVPIYVDNYFEVLFRNSYHVIRVIHLNHFPKCIEICLKPVTEAILAIKSRSKKEEEPVSIPLSIPMRAPVPMRAPNTTKWLSLSNKSINSELINDNLIYVKSVQFREDFRQYLRQLKKSFCIFTNMHLQWIDSMMENILSKYSRSMQLYLSQKDELLINLHDLKDKTDNYTSFVRIEREKEIEIIGLQFELTGPESKRILEFTLHPEDVIDIIKQFIDCVEGQLTLEQAIECYRLQVEKTPYLKETELHILTEMMSSFDQYNSKTISETTERKCVFVDRFNQLLMTNFVEIRIIVEVFNEITASFNEAVLESSEGGNLVGVFEFIENMKIKLLHLPCSVLIGLFNLDFTLVRDELQLLLERLQGQISENIPSEFKKLYETSYKTLEVYSSRIKASVWTIEELLSSNEAYEEYQSYRINSLFIETEKLKLNLDIINKKCPNSYHDCLMMSLNFKSAVDRLNSKAESFNLRFGRKLKFLRPEIIRLKEKIWNGLYLSQSRLIAFAQNSLEESEIDFKEKIEILMNHDTNLIEIKQNMEKLEIIHKLQMEHFLETETNINSHSYEKVKTDLSLLINFLKKGEQFDNRLKSILNKSIFKVSTEEYLEELKENVYEIKQVSMLLITYENLVNSIIVYYDKKRRFLETIGEMYYLSIDEVVNICRNKELEIIIRPGLTVKDCLGMQIERIYHELHFSKEKKGKIAQMRKFMEVIDEKSNVCPFELKNTEEPKIYNEKDYDNKERSKSKKKRTELNTFKKLTQLSNCTMIYDTNRLEQHSATMKNFQNGVRLFMSSPYLTDFKAELSAKERFIISVLKIFEMVSQAQKECLSIIGIDFVGVMDDKIDKEKLSPLAKEERTTFFNFQKIQLDIKEHWEKMVYELKKKTIADLLSYNQDISYIIKNFKQKIRELRELVDTRIKRKRNEAVLLHLVDTSLTLSIIQNPLTYFTTFFPIRTIREFSDCLELVSNYNELLTLPHNNTSISINDTHNKMVKELHNIFMSKLQIHPISNVANYMDDCIPLQILYALDQLYLRERYMMIPLTHRKEIIKGVEGEIKMICKDSLIKGLDNSKLDYGILMFGMLFSARVELRSRLEIPDYETWFPDVLVTELDGDQLQLRCFNIKTVYGFQLIDANAVSGCMPYCEKLFVKICSVMGNEHCAVVKEAETVAVVAARTMNLFYRSVINAHNVENMLTACQLFPLFMLGVVSQLQEGLDLVFGHLNRIQMTMRIENTRISEIKIREDGKLLTESGKSILRAPTIYLYSPKHCYETIPDRHKIRFRELGYVPPCCEIVLCCKMMSYGCLVDRNQYHRIIALMETYLITAQQKQAEPIKVKEMSTICDKILRKECFETTNIDLAETCISYFMNFGIDLCTLKSTLRLQKVSSDCAYANDFLYSLMEDIIHTKHDDIMEDTLKIMSSTNKEYETMTREFEKYKDILGYHHYPNNFLNLLDNFHEACFQLEYQPIAVVGEHQTGKSLLIDNYLEFRKEIVGSHLFHLQIYNVACFDVLLEPLSLTDSIIDDMLFDTYSGGSYWLLFEGFFEPENNSLCEFLFNNLNGSADFSSYATACELSLFFSDSEYKKETYRQRIKISHHKNVIFELTTLEGLSPALVCSLTKIIFAETTMELKDNYYILVDNFLTKLVNKDELHRASDMMHRMFPFINNVVDEIIIKRQKNFQWICVVSEKSILHGTMKLFMSFFQVKSKEKLQIIVSTGQDFVGLKLMAYCLHCTLDHCLERSTVNNLEKVIKSAYYKISEEIHRENFLSKLVVFTDKGISYYEYDSVLPCKQLPNNPTIVETREMRIIEAKCLNQLAAYGSIIYLLGSRESGKTTLLNWFMDKYYRNESVIRGDLSNKEFLIQINKRLDQSESRMSKNSVTSLSTKSVTHRNRKNMDCVLFVEDVSLGHTTLAERYIKYIAQHSQILRHKVLTNVELFSAIIERRTASEQVLKENWNSYLISLQLSPNNIESIFIEFLERRLEGHFKTETWLQKLEFLPAKYLKLYRYCNENYKRLPRTWTYDFGTRSLKWSFMNFIDDLLGQTSYLNEDDFVRKMDDYVYNLLSFRMQNAFTRHHLASMKPNEQEQRMRIRGGKTLSSVVRESMRQDKLLFEFTKKTPITDEIIQTNKRFQYAVRHSSVIMINKQNISLCRPIAEILLEMQGMISRELEHCPEESIFIGQVGKIEDQDSECSYLIRLEDVINNTELLRFVENYCMNARQIKLNSKTNKSIIDTLEGTKFVVEYSNEDYELIAKYLEHRKLLDCSFVLFMEDSRDDELEVLACHLLRRNSSEDTIVNTNELAKQLYRFYCELECFEMPKHIAKYFSSSTNFTAFIECFSDCYYETLQRVSTKKNFLELSLSELSYLFKEYKEMKMEYKMLINQKSDLIKCIQKEQLELKAKTKDYNSLVNQHIKENLTTNEITIKRLTKEKEALLASEKTLYNNYEYAHNAICRNDIAEIKSYLINHNSDKEIFQLIACVLGEEETSASIKKCFTDVNLMVRIKEVDLLTLEETELKMLEERTDGIWKKEKLWVGRNIIEWIRCAAKLGLYRLHREEMLVKIESRLGQLKHEQENLKGQNNTDELEETIATLEGSISCQEAELTRLTVRNKELVLLLSNMETQFEELIHFENYCLEEKGKLMKFMDRVLGYCLWSVVEFSFANLLHKESRRKFVNTYQSRLRKIFNYLLDTKDDECYQQLQAYDGEGVTTPSWNLKGKSYLSENKKKLIDDLNRYIQTGIHPLIIIDKYYIFSQDVEKSHCLILSMEELRNSPELKYDEHALVIIELNSWVFTLSTNKHSDKKKHKIFRHKDIRCTIPYEQSLVFIIRKECDWPELMSKFKVVNLDYSSEDYYEMIKNVSLAKLSSDIVISFTYEQKLVYVERKFAGIMFFLCKKTQSINILNKGLIGSLIEMVLDFNQALTESKSYSYHTHKEKFISNNSIKIYRMVGNTIDIVKEYFPTSRTDSYYFRSVFEVASDYAKREGHKCENVVLHIFMDILSKGVSDRNAFLYLYYFKVFCVEEGIGSATEANNILAVAEPKSLVDDCLKDETKDHAANMFKYMHEHAPELEKFVTIIRKNRILNPQEILSQITRNDHHTQLGSLLLKKLLLGLEYDKEIRLRLLELAQTFRSRGKNSLKGFISGHKLFSLCNVHYWYTQFNKGKEYDVILLNDINRMKYSKCGICLVFDCLDSSYYRNKYLTELEEIDWQDRCLVLCSNQYLPEYFLEGYKCLPFEQVLELIYGLTVESNELRKVVSRVNGEQSKLTRDVCFEMKIIMGLELKKLAQEIIKSKLTPARTRAYLQWNYFSWGVEDNPQLNAGFSWSEKLFTIECGLEGTIAKRIEQIVLNSKVCVLDEVQLHKLFGQSKFTFSQLLAPRNVEQSACGKEVIFFREMQYKKTRLQQIANNLAYISDLSIGKHQITPETILEGHRLLTSFNLSELSDSMLKLIRWRQSECHQEILNIFEIEDKVLLFYLFEDYIYDFRRLLSIDLYWLKTKQQAIDKKEKLPRDSSVKLKKSRSLTALAELKKEEDNKIVISKREVRKNVEQSELHKQALRAKRKSYQILSSNIEPVPRLKRFSIGLTFEIDSVDKIEETKNEEAILSKFREDVYMINGRLIGIKRITLKEIKTASTLQKMSIAYLLPDYQLSMYEHQHDTSMMIPQTAQPQITRKNKFVSKESTLSIDEY